MRLILSFIYRHLILVLIGLSVFILFLDFSYLKLNTADSSIYLSTAQNIAGHKGLVVSYNLCQSFKTLYHPLLSYYQPLYSIFASLFINHGGIVRIIQVNVLLLALNTVLIFYLIQNRLSTRFNVLFIFFLVFSPDFFISAVYPWTEQFHFFCFITTFILFFKYSKDPKVLFGLGILNAGCMLVRVAHMYNFAAYLPVLFIGKDPLRQKFDRALSFIGGFLLAYGLYQLFCLAHDHVLYPEYARPGASYGLAHLTEGIIYQPPKVGIQAFVGPFFTSSHLQIIGHHLWSFYRQMPLFLWASLYYFFIPIEKRRDGGMVALCVSQSIFMILGYSCTFYWLPFHFESLRYSIIPYVLLSVAGWYCLYQGFSCRTSRLRKLLVGAILLAFLYAQVQQFIKIRSEFFNHPLWRENYYKDLMEAYRWIDAHLPQDVLVASDEDQQGYFMHRPFISTPPGRSFNCVNLGLYNQIYLPDYYLLSLAIADQCFTAMPHKEIFSNKNFRLFQMDMKGRHPQDSKRS